MSRPNPLTWTGGSPVPVTNFLDSTFEQDQGTIIVRDAVGWSGLLIGPSGSVLTSPGPNGGAPYWSSAGSGSGTVSSGTSGQLTYYAATGTTVSGLTLGTNLSITSGTLNASGTGTVNAGTSGQIAYYAGAGTAVSGTNTGLTINTCINPITTASAGSLNFALTNWQSQTLTTSNTTLSFSGVSVGQQLVIMLVQDATGGRTVTWPSGITWASGGLAPVLSPNANAVDTVILKCTGSGTYIGYSTIPQSAVSTLAPTLLKTGAYTAAPGDFVPCSTASSAFTITLPSAPADQSQIGVKLVTAGNTLTIAASGADVFNTASGPTSKSLTIALQGVWLQYMASTKIWYTLAATAGATGAPPP